MIINTDYGGGAASTVDAAQMANDLQDALDCSEDSLEVLTEFHEQMADRKHDSYAVLEVTGLGTIAEAFVWWMDDQSILIVGWQDEETMMIGVLPAGAEFTPVPYWQGSVVTVH